MRKRTLTWLLMLLTLILVAGACTPKTFTAPMQIHINPGDHIEQAAIAMDSHGMSHITGVVNDRVVYYRTRYGPPIMTLTMTMTGSGTDWKQFDPDIAVTDSGHAYLVWVEQRGSTDKIACWREVPFATDHPYYTTCSRLDSENYTMGNIKVVSRGEAVYAVYDRKYSGGNYVDSLWFKELRHPTTNYGKVINYLERMETATIYSIDAIIDSTNKLHVAFMDHDDTTDDNHLRYASNYNVDGLGDMAQFRQMWPDAVKMKWMFDVCITLYQAVEERVAVSAVYQVADHDDRIGIESCRVADCHVPWSQQVLLDTSWDDHPLIGDTKIVGIDDNLFISFIGDNNTGAGGYPQIYMKSNIDTNSVVFTLSDAAATKTDLEMQKLELRDESGSVVPVVAWLDFSGLLKRFYTSAGLTDPTKVFEASCGAGYERQDDIAANGVYYAGVMEACGDTWFSANAYISQLPMILK